MFLIPCLWGFEGVGRGGEVEELAYGGGVEDEGVPGSTGCLGEEDGARGRDFLVGGGTGEGEED